MYHKGHERIEMTVSYITNLQCTMSHLFSVVLLFISFMPLSKVKDKGVSLEKTYLGN